MRTSISEIIRTEKFLRGELGEEERVSFEKQLAVDPHLKANTLFQKLVHRLLLLYHRKKLKAEVQAVHKRLMSDPAKAEFRRSIINIFNP